MMMLIGCFAITGLLALAFDEGVMGEGASIVLFAATAAAWVYLLW